MSATVANPLETRNLFSYWLRGYRHAPEMVIAVGFARAFLESNFESCHVAGQVTNRYSVENEETRDHPEIFVCRALRQPWPTFWQGLRRYGSRAARFMAARKHNHQDGQS